MNSTEVCSRSLYDDLKKKKKSLSSNHECHKNSLGRNLYISNKWKIKIV